MATLDTEEEWPFKIYIPLPDSFSQIRTEQSQLPDTINLLSKLMATLDTEEEWPFKI